MKKVFKFLDNTLVTISLVQKYSNGVQAIVLLDAIQNIPYAVLSVNFVNAWLWNNETVIKEYEMPGTLAWLVSNNIVEDTGRKESSGFVTAPIVLLQPEESWTAWEEMSQEHLDALAEAYYTEQYGASSADSDAKAQEDAMYYSEHQND